MSFELCGCADCGWGLQLQGCYLSVELSFGSLRANIGAERYCSNERFSLRNPQVGDDSTLPYFPVTAHLLHSQ